MIYLKERNFFSLLILLVLCLAGYIVAGERFIPEHFTGGWGSTDWGPAVQAQGSSSNNEASGTLWPLCSDKQGNVYLGGAKDYQFIDMVTPEGMRYHIAGREEVGFRDGLARHAMFKMGRVAGYGEGYSMGCGPDGSIFVCDNGNYRVRRLYKQAGEWYVQTWAGGGTISTTSMAVGRTVSTKDVQFIYGFQLAVNKFGEVYVASPWGGQCKINAAGDSITKLGNFPVAAGDPPTEGFAGTLMMGCADTVGNVYFIARTPDRAFRIDSNDVMSHISINPGLRGINPPDGPPLQIYFDTPASMGCAPDGSCIYICGGDQYNIVRSPTDLVTSTSKLGQNGVFSPGAFTKSGGDFVTDGPSWPLRVCIVHGVDIAGNIYGALYPWSGLGLFIDGMPPQSKLFRLRRVVD
jgi:hypothetical protein